MTARGVLWRLVCALILAMGPGLASADAQSGYVSVPEMRASLPKIKDAAVQSALRALVTGCTEGNWGACQAARFDAQKAMSHRTDEMGNVYGVFKEPSANLIYFSMLDGLNGPSYRSQWDMVVSYKGRVAPVGEMLADPSVSFLFWKLVWAAASERNIRMDVTTMFRSEKAEWLRAVVWAYALRGETSFSTQALHELRNSVKIKEDVVLYNKTLDAWTAWTTRK